MNVENLDQDKIKKAEQKTLIPMNTYFHQNTTKTDLFILKTAIYTQLKHYQIVQSGNLFL